jgi:hypothetical protein
MTVAQPIAVPPVAVQPTALTRMGDATKMCDGLDAFAATLGVLGFLLGARWLVLAMTTPVDVFGRSKAQMS